MKKTTIFAVIIVVIAAVIIFFPRNKEHSVYIHDALGTVSEIRIYHKNDHALKKCKEYIYKMDSLLSLTRPESEISRLNSGESVSLSAETEDILKKAQELSDESFFNPFCGELIEVWDMAKAESILPDPQKISQAKSKSYPITLNYEDGAWTLVNQKVNLGGIAKGYILDGIVKILTEEKVESALIYLGGSVYAKGENQAGDPWRIGIKNPDSEASYMGIVSVKDRAVTTSGDYERYFEVEGKRYHHILDLKTGYPAESGLKSVTIISKDATLGDYLSTKCFVLGFDKSKELIEKYKVSAIFITDDRQVFYTKDLEDSFSKIDKDYSYEAF